MVDPAVSDFERRFIEAAAEDVGVDPSGITITPEGLVSTADAPTRTIIGTGGRTSIRQITPPSISQETSLQGTATTEQLIQQEFIKQPQRELAATIEKGFKQPIRQQLGTAFPNVPESIKFAEEILFGLGTPLFVLSDPKAVEQAIEVIKRRPEKLTEIALQSAAFPFIAGKEIVDAAIGTRKVGKGVRVQEVGIGRVLGKGVSALSAIGIAAAVGVGVPKILKVPTRGKVFKGAAKPRLIKPKLKPKTIFTTKDLLKDLIIKEKTPPKPPKITRVIDRGLSVEFIIESGGKVVERRFVVKTDTAILKSQINVAKVQGAKFIGLKPPTTTGRIIIVEPFKSPSLTKPNRTAPIQVDEIAFTGVISGDIPAFSEAQKSVSDILTTSVFPEITKTSDAFRSIEKQITPQLTPQIQPQAQPALQEILQQPLLSSLVEPIKITKTGKVKQPKLPFAFPIIIPELKTKKILKKKGLGIGYNAFVKERGRIRKLNTRPRTKAGALSIGAQFVDTTPAASFTIRKSKNKAELNGGELWEILKPKFRPRKTKNALELVEKSQFRIDSIGELQGITQKGIDVRRAI